MARPLLCLLLQGAAALAPPQGAARVAPLQGATLGQDAALAPPSPPAVPAAPPITVSEARPATLDDARHEPRRRARRRPAAWRPSMQLRDARLRRIQPGRRLAPARLRECVSTKPAPERDVVDEVTRCPWSAISSSTRSRSSRGLRGRTGGTCATSSTRGKNAGPPERRRAACSTATSRHCGSSSRTTTRSRTWTLECGCCGSTHCTRRAS